LCGRLGACQGAGSDVAELARPGAGQPGLTLPDTVGKGPTPVTVKT
jgi:hypothetical protein